MFISGDRESEILWRSSQVRFVGGSFHIQLCMRTCKYILVRISSGSIVKSYIGELSQSSTNMSSFSSWREVCVV
jgi:hypothetical protein